MDVGDKFTAREIAHARDGRLRVVRVEEIDEDRITVRTVSHSDGRRNRILRRDFTKRFRPYVPGWDDDET